MTSKPKTALLIIDVQEAFNERVALGHQRNNPTAEENIAKLLAAFRSANQTIIHVHHDSANPDSLFRAGRSGNAVQAFVKPLDGEQAIRKSANSAFIGTRLETYLRENDITHLVVCGATTNHCVETTTRMAGNLGFDTILARDACWAFDQSGVDGELLTATQVHQMSLANLNQEFAKIDYCDEIIQTLTEL